MAIGSVQNGQVGSSQPVPLSYSGEPRTARAILGQNQSGVMYNTQQLAAAIQSNPALSSDILKALSPVQQGEVLRLAQAGSGTSGAKANEKAPDVGKQIFDITQMGLDIAGIFDPTPASDIASAGMSAVNRDLGGVIISGASAAFPYLGDLAKLGKLGKWAKTISNSIELAKSSPAARQLIEPALRGVSQALAAIPKAALDKLPASAQKSIRQMRNQLDEFLGISGKDLNNADKLKNLPLPAARKVGDLRGGLLEKAQQVSGKFKLDNGPPNGRLFRANQDGTITSYIVYDSKGIATKRVDLTGAAHRGVPTPHVVEYGRSTLPDGSTRANTNTKEPPRAARANEIP